MRKIFGNINGTKKERKKAYIFIGVKIIVMGIILSFFNLSIGLIIVLGGLILIIPPSFNLIKWKSDTYYGVEEIK